jgi:MoaA/NifB/PqqE/SkfB family radical SAM enzyme
MGLRIRTGEMDKFKECMGNNCGYELQEIKVYLTKTCNSRCIMCAGGDDTDTASEITREELGRIIGESKQLGLRRVKLFGGEPTLRKDLSDIISDCTSLGIESQLTSNGLLINAQKASELVSAGLGGLVLSIDSVYPGLNDYIRGVEGSYERVIGALKAVDSERRKQKTRLRIHVNSVVMRLNYFQLPKLVRFCLENKVDGLSLNPVTPNPRLNSRAKDISLLFPSEGDISIYNEEVVPEVLSMGVAEKFGLTESYLYFFGQDKRSLSNATRGYFVERFLNGCTCLKPWYYANINQKGEMIGCKHLQNCEEYAIIGSLRKQSVNELWNSDRYRNFRAKCKDPLHYFQDCISCCYPYAVTNSEINIRLNNGQ